MFEKSKPIQFTTEMVLALLAGKKTQTRRTVKLPPSYGWLPAGTAGDIVNRHNVRQNITTRPAPIPCPYGDVGDTLRVCEAWSHDRYPHPADDDNPVFFYRADYAEDPHGFDGEKSTEGKYRKWLSGNVMPPEASRIWLRITDIRVELLHQITEADARAEGVEPAHDPSAKQLDWLDGGTFALNDEPTHKAGFKRIWEGIYGRGSWQWNPWLWVIDFEIQSNKWGM